MRVNYVVLGGLILGSVFSTAEAATLTLSPAYVDFGEVRVGETSNPVNINIQYTKEYSDSKIYAYFTDGLYTKITSNTCLTPFSLSCSFSVEFTAPYEGDIYDQVGVLYGEFFPNDPDRFSVSPSGLDVHAFASTTSTSPVPLPASAPMFGAALLGLAGLGYAAKRKHVIAAV